MMNQITYEVVVTDPPPDTFDTLTGAWAEHFDGDLDATGDLEGGQATVTAHLYRELDGPALAAAFVAFLTASLNAGVHITSLRVLASEGGHATDD